MTALPSGFDSKRPLHAYLLVGAAVAVHETLVSMAASLVCENAEKTDAYCGVCPACKKVAAGTHPDVRLLNGASCGVDDVRALRDDTVYAPNEAERKLYLLENFERFNPASQNALLKVLEEPPERVTFLLGASTASGILATVLSRVKTLFLPRTDLAVAARKTLGEGADEEKTARLAAFLADYPDIDASSLDPAAFFAACEASETLLAAGDPTVFAAFPKTRDGAALYFRVLMHDTHAITVKKRAPDVARPLPSPLAGAAMRLSAARAFRLYELFENCFTALQDNGNVNAVVAYAAIGCR